MVDVALLCAGEPTAEEEWDPPSRRTKKAGSRMLVLYVGLQKVVSTKRVLPCSRKESDYSHGVPDVGHRPAKGRLGGPRSDRGRGGRPLLQLWSLGSLRREERRLVGR